MFGSEVKDTQQRQQALNDLVNDSLDKSSNADDSVIIGQMNINLQSAPNSGKKTTPYTSKLLQSDSRNLNPAASLGDPQLYFNKDANYKIQSFRQTPLIQNQSSTMKGQNETSLPPKQKKEFEEIYKKSTENLYFAPTVRSIEGTHRQQQKYNIWKSQTGKLGDLKLSQKPPKHQNQQRKSRQAIDQNSQQQQQIKIVVKNEEKKVLQKSHEGIYSDRNSTDEDQRAPILGKNLSQFNKIMFSKPFDKTKKQQPQPHSSNQQQTQMKHKRQLSGGMGNVQIRGDNNNQQSILNLNSHLMENIEPEDDNKLYQSANKQIEIMQIGRSRKKSSNKKSSNQAGSKPQSRRGSNNPNSYNYKAPSVAKVVANTNKNSYINNFSSANSNPIQTKSTTVPAQKNNQVNSKIVQQAKDYPNIREEQDREIGLNNKINYKSIQAKTVQSSSYSSIQSFGSSHNSNKIQQIESILQENEVKRKLIEKEQLEKEELKLDQLDESYFSSQSQSEVTIKPSKINVINQSIDLRDSKKGEFLRLRSQAGVVSPVNENRNNNNMLSVSKYTPQQVQTRIHSFSQYADLDAKNRVLEKINMKSLNDKSIDDLQQNDLNHLSKYNAFRSQIKPLNKLTFEASNQIAKLSGDVDHEPSTPKSGTNISDDDDE